MQSLKAIQPTLQLLLVARLTEKKGISDAIHAVRFLQNHGIDTVLHIVGDGENRLILEETVQRLELQKQVQFHGFLNQMQVKEHFNVSDIFILPSVIAKDGDMEGIPVSLMEAMAQGKPVISTIHSGIPELVIHGKTGFLVPERDAEALGRAIIDYLNLTDSQKAELIVNARQKVVAEFDINRLNNVLFQDGAW
ncbi:glycosyltransferase [Listeria rocourtiae]|nr:glycosyltransferase [Listeria rocourtiae]EUJ44161.1 colanic acid biosynthesis glycosyltransferase WcaL [Listeria rocourtiae FSL F6-920]